MRIAAGVLLILAGVFNGCAGTGYAFGGAAGAAAVEGAGALSKAMMEEAAKEGNADAKAAAEAMAEVNANANDAKAAAGGMMIFGFFLLVMLGLQIAGGVVLFMSKAAKFVLVVGALGILAELGGMAFGVPFGLTNIIGIVGSVLAIMASKAYADGGGAAPAAPAAEG
jgi:hypothetical protein